MFSVTCLQIIQRSNCSHYRFLSWGTKFLEKVIGWSDCLLPLLLYATLVVLSGLKLQHNYSRQNDKIYITVVSSTIGIRSGHNVLGGTYNLIAGQLITIALVTTEQSSCPACF